MTPRSAKLGDLVRIRWVVLRPEERPASLPPDTRAVPFVAWVNGYLEAKEAARGAEVTVVTAIGRRFTGELVEIDPRTDHDFGDPQPELLRAATQLRQILG